MHLSGPSSAQTNQSITVTASGLPDRTDKVEFQKQGAGVWDTGDVRASGGSASWSFTCDFAGTASITATAKDDMLNQLGSASLSIAVSDSSFAPAAPSGNPVEDRFRIYGYSHARVGEPWVVTMKSVAKAHSVVFELYGANGGIYRTFPRGRDEYGIQFRFAKAGTTELYGFSRDEVLAPLAWVKGVIEVSEGSAYAAGGMVELAASGRSAPVLGAAKPHFAAFEPVAAQPAAATAGGAGGPTATIEARKAALMNRLSGKG
ncbi:MAG: hypothetical protein AAFX03_12300 [Pseudomonadota bacterium]